MEHNNIPVSKQVKTYLEKRPYIIEAIEQKIVNYSALSRKICNELKIQNKDTVKTAIIRLGKSNRNKRKNAQDKAIKIVRNASFSVKNKVATLHHSTFVNIKAIAYSKTPSGYVFFLDEQIAEKSTFRNIEYGFAIIHIKSSKEIENTPGWFALLFHTLALEGINVPHVMGVREDTFIVVKEHDAPLAFKALAQKLRV
jgi:hypothetical protein